MLIFLHNPDSQFDDTPGDIEVKDFFQWIIAVGSGETGSDSLKQVVEHRCSAWAHPYGKVLLMLKLSQGLVVENTGLRFSLALVFWVSDTLKMCIYRDLI